MDQFSIDHFPKLLQMAYSAVATKALLYVAILMTFGLFSTALYLGTVLSLVAAAAFAVLVFLPVLLRKENPSGSDS